MPLGTCRKRVLTQTQATTCVEGWAAEKPTALDVMAMSLMLACLACCVWLIYALPKAAPLIQQIVQDAIGCATGCPR